jgi:hypothetical protein
MENKSTNEDDLKFKSKIKDWGLSHTTLEEVFMKVKDEELYYVLIAFRLRAHTEVKKLNLLFLYNKIKRVLCVSSYTKYWI